MIKSLVWGFFKLIRNAFVIVLLLFWIVCLYNGSSFLSPSGSPECSRPSGRWREQQQGEAGSMHVQLKQLPGCGSRMMRYGCVMSMMTMTMMMETDKHKRKVLKKRIADG